MAFAKNQPKHGETVLHCNHVMVAKHNHFFMIPETVFTRPDGSTGKSKWIVLCESCFLTHANDPTKCIRGDSSWKGDEPAIKDVSN